MKFDRGITHSLTSRSIDRRTMLRALGGASLALVGCGTAMQVGDSDGGVDSGSNGGDLVGGGSDGPSSCKTIPEETAGPYPDKTGMFTNQAFYRSDVTEGKTGLPLSVTLTVVDVAAGCAPLVGAVVEIWHCDKDGVYSEYGGQPGVADQTGTTFLRGLQATNAAGQATFKTIYPGWYAGRATHIHIEVFRAGSSQVAKTTQLAFPDALNTAVYGKVALYTKGDNPTRNATDMVFGDGDELQVATLAGDTTNGYAAALLIGI